MSAKMSDPSLPLATSAAEYTFTSRDFAILTGMLVHRGVGPERISTIIRAKLARAAVVDSWDIDPDVVTIGSRVLFRVNGAKPQEQILGLGTVNGMESITLPVWSIRGASLLGLSVGASFTAGAPGSEEVLTLDMVLFQPQADADVNFPRGR